MIEEEEKGKGKKRGFLNKILDGRILGDERIMRHGGLLALIVFYIFIYVGNRYAIQQELREIAQLKKEVQEMRYDALERKSELSEKSRQSHIQEYVQQRNSELKIATTPPFLIK